MVAEYEVTPYNSGDGFFISGGRLRGMFIAEKQDAENICAALNLVEKLKVLGTLVKIEDALSSLEELRGLLINGN